MKVTPESVPQLAPRLVEFVLEAAVPLSSAVLEESGRGVIQAVLPPLSALLPDSPPSVSWDEGAWEVTTKITGRRAWRVDLRRDLIGAKFQQPAQAAQAIEVLKHLVRAGFDLLGLGSARKLTINIVHWWKLVVGDNRSIIGASLLPAWGGSPLAQLFADPTQLGRFDCKTSFPVPPNFNAFVSLELPANRDHQTVWTSIAFGGREGGPSMDVATAIATLDAAVTTYRGPFARFVASILNPLDVEQSGVWDE